MNGEPRVIIVGGGFGGLAAARALRRTRAEVVLVDRQNHHVFQPLLYQVATAALSPANIAHPIRRILRKQKNCRVVMGEVNGVDVEARTVDIGGHPYVYDYLVLATGARTNYFGHDEWAADAPGLKTIGEALDIRGRYLLAFEQAAVEADPDARRAALTFALVGAGPTGVEMAGAMAEIARHILRRELPQLAEESVRVLLIDMAERVLPSFPPSLSERARRDLEALGVEVQLATRVVDLDAKGLTVECAGARQRIESLNVIWAAGVRATELGAGTGAETDPSGRVLVGDDLSIPGHGEVFVVGDLARRVDPRSAQPVPGVAQGALQMGRFAGRVIAREIAERQAGKPAPSRPTFVYRDKGSLATIGRNRAVADVHGLRFGGRLAFFFWGLVHVFFLIDFRQRLLTLAEWVWMYAFHDRGARLITGEDSLPRPVVPPADPRADRSSG